MKQIENGLQGYYSSTHSNVEMSCASNQKEIYENPFAKVTTVSPGSPAEYAVSSNIIN